MQSGFCHSISSDQSCQHNTPRKKCDLGRVRKLGFARDITECYERGDLTNTPWERPQPLLPLEKPSTGTSRSRLWAHGEWHLVDSAHRCALAGCARALWSLVHGGQPLLPVAQSRDGGVPLRGGAKPGRGAWPRALRSARRITAYHSRYYLHRRTNRYAIDLYSAF